MIAGVCWKLLRVFLQTACLLHGNCSLDATNGDCGTKVSGEVRSKFYGKRRAGVAECPERLAGE